MANSIVENTANVSRMALAGVSAYEVGTVIESWRNG